MKHLIISIYDSGWGFSVLIIEDNKVIENYADNSNNIATELNNRYDYMGLSDLQDYVLKTYSEKFDTICCIDNAEINQWKGNKI